MSLILHFEKKKGNNGKILRVISVILHPNFPDFYRVLFLAYLGGTRKKKYTTFKRKIVVVVEIYGMGHRIFQDFSKL